MFLDNGPYPNKLKIIVINYNLSVLPVLPEAGSFQLFPSYGFRRGDTL